ncbi:MAG: hypothetical protein AB1898_27935 [Acidobacteriota bacterium]
MKTFEVILALGLGVTAVSPLWGSGTSTPPPISGASNAEAFQFESVKARIVSVNTQQGTVLLKEEKRKNPREITLKVNAKTTLKAGKEKLQLQDLMVGALVKAVFDREFNAVSIRIQKEKA